VQEFAVDDARFDMIIKRFADSTTRRATFRLLAGGIFGAWLSQRHRPLAHAQRPDSDQDGLFDDDETNVYFTRPDLFDTDGDGVGDGEEIYNRDNGLAGPNDPLTPVGGGAACPVGQFDCGAGCTDLSRDAAHCGTCALACDVANGHSCVGGFCTLPAAPTCIALGGQCAQFSDCCPGDHVQCCFNVSGAGTCQDVSQTSFVCTGWADVPATGCPVGMTDCGEFCTNLSTDHGNCGACGNRCSQVCGPDCNCINGICTAYCTPGLTSCGGVCVDLQSDAHNCGTCGNACGADPVPLPGTNGNQADLIPRFCTYGRCSLPF
jgi:hypothetical protein